MREKICKPVECRMLHRCICGRKPRVMNAGGYGTLGCDQIRMCAAYRFHRLGPSTWVVPIIRDPTDCRKAIGKAL
jgi:hypothetical protein